jgi:hypothetical protein
MFRKAEKTTFGASGTKRRPRRWRKLLVVLVVLGLLLGAARLAMPWAVRSYVNRTIARSPLYEGRIGDVSIHLWRGAYTIHDIRISKTTGNVPVPLFAAKRVDLAIERDALLHGKVVGRIVMDSPELNFVDGGDDATSQTGAGGPWLQIIRDLFPFKINRTQVENGSIHFRAFQRDPPVDVYLSELQGSIDNLTNIQDEVTPLIATIRAKALAMDQAKFEYEMKLDPFSYKPTFQLAVRLIGLDATKTNALTRAYGAFDFEKGFFDLVIELNSREGSIDGYIKPLFRNIQILSLDKDIKQDNVLEFFWEALVGFASDLLTNPPRDQFGTLIPLRGDLSGPSADILATIGNVLRNAFIRAYLPRLQGTTQDLNGLEFGRGSVLEPAAIGNKP